MSKLYFTRAGADRIIRQKDELFKKLRETEQQKGEAVKTGGNDWHDNFSFEQLTLKEQALSAQISQLNDRINRMIVVEKVSTDTNNLRIGQVAVLYMGGEEKSYLVGGFEDFDPGTNPPTISYLAPLIQPFIGEERSYVAEIQIEGKAKYITLLDIKLLNNEEEKK